MSTKTAHTRRNARVILGVLAVIAALGASTVAFGQARRLILEDFEVKGKVQKPEITIFVTRQNLNPEYNLDLRESFIPKIVESTEKKPF